MNHPVTVKVNFRGSVKKFPVVDTDKAQWETVEAWIKTTFGLCHFQAKYFDEDNEEISINSQDEYAEALKSAFKQANQLHMNVYKMKGQAEGGPVKAEVKEHRIDPRPAPPYRARVKMADKETQVTPERDSVVVKENKVNKVDEEPVPAWFKSYMDRFKDQVVREVVDKMCSEFSGQCCTHRASDPPEEPRTSGTQMAVVSSTTQRTSIPNCSSCKGPATGGGYHCSVCPSCILCEPCSHKHDPSHNLKRTRTPLSVPERGVTPEPRFLRRGDRTVRKAERQRLKAERRQLKAEVKEIKKKLRLEKRGLLWSGATNGTSSSGLGPAPAPAPAPGAAAAPGPEPQASSPEGPKVSCSTLVPTMTALFLDENLPDGTCLEPGTKFIKYWKMRNTGNIGWTSDTKLKFMWGNLALESQEQKEVAVPFLKPGQVGMVSVAFVAPMLEGTYTSHWRLAHCGVQFGPRVWCSIVVVPSSGQKLNSHSSKAFMNKHSVLGMDVMCWTGSRDDTRASSSSKREYYIPSVDLLTAQDLLSFELLDINIVQELEKVPANTPADMTPCMSPVPHYGPTFGKHGLGLVKENAEHTGMKKLQVVQPQRHSENVDLHVHDEGDDDISGTQFVCETVIRSLTLEEEPEHKPRRVRVNHSRPEHHDPTPFKERSLIEKIDRPLLPIIKRPEAPPPAQPPIILEQPDIPVFSEMFIGSNENLYTDPAALEEEEVKEEDQDKEEEAGEWDEVSSQASSASSEEYLVVLPDCFDTSKPLGDSLYSSAVSQAGNAFCAEPERAQDQTTAERETVEPTTFMQNSVNRLLCTSQILNTPPLIPEVAPTPVSLSPPPALRTHRSIQPFVTEIGTLESEQNRSCPPENKTNGLGSTHLEAPASAFETCSSQDPRLRHGGLTEGLVKGALSVAASAYKALFTGQSSSTQRPSADPASKEASLIAVLQEMGFSNKLLNQKLLRKHQYNLLDVVNELVQMTDNEWYTTRH
ncbi:NBR1 autophagy cargo receptor a isoform X1 [Ictalurus punctatus]|uniref:NBR1 autophagy cargo receptor a isoform X1 n=2 Tax=Ictalurus punctatus TaxID=7998 RepID=A0A2D0S9N5_ICTPU|nr:NBR1 autophagy cargo receptor a isoform X1 [Ictalurus punctatus]